MMRKVTFVTLIITICFLIMLGCGRSSNNQSQNGRPPNPPINEGQTPDDLQTPPVPGNQDGQDSEDAEDGKNGSDGTTVDKIQKQLDRMTLDEKLGQMVIVGIDAYTMDAYAQEMMETNKVGGFILFKKNVQDPQQLTELLNDLKAANPQKNVPLFLAVDEEGGRVSRMPEQLRKFPTNAVIGEVNDGNFSFEIGSVIANEIKSFGFNLNFAPVLDIYSNPKNTVIGDRSFGTTPEIVSKLGIETMKGMASQHVIPVVKHFPGHGDTSVDSHVGLPIIDHSLDRLKQFELIPFAEAIESGADAVMTAHIVLAEIDPLYPASMSKGVITDLLRNEMKFGGVVFTDDMTMGAIVENYGIGEAAVRSVNAGSDIILVCHKYELQMAVIQALKQAADSGEIVMERIDDSVYRILKLKQKYEVADTRVSSVDVKQINDQIDSVLEKYSTAE